MKKAIIIILSSILALALIFGIMAGAFISSMSDPKPLVCGDGGERIVCVGDSITYAQGVMWSRGKDSFTAILADITDSTTVNYGLCNHTLLSTGDNPYTSKHQYTDSLRENADKVIIMLGSNDTKPTMWDGERFESEYREFIRGYMDMASSPKVYVMIPPRVYRAQDGKTCDDATIGGELTKIVNRLSQELGFEIIDLYTLTTDHPEWYSDELHPNAEGNRAIAEEIARVIGE